MSTQELYEVATLANCDYRSVERYLNSKIIRRTRQRTRIEAALQKLGKAKFIRHW